MLLQCEEADGKNPLGPPACLRFRFLPSCRHYGSLDSRNNKNSPRLSPLQVKIIILYNICKWHYLLHPPKTVHYHNYRLFNNTAFSCYSDLVFSQTNKQKKPILFIYLAQMLYSQFWTFPMFLLKVSLFQRDLKVCFTELIQRKSRFSFYLH